MELLKAVPCIFWFGFPSGTFWAAAEHSHLECQISFETAGLAKDLASLHVGISVCLFFLPELARGVCAT